ncbi:hypothetical protein K4G97_26225, partial [Mycobacterium tuberculosis]|nr:hypothetical protein [Mycobacterium tuberculosis]
FPPSFILDKSPANGILYSSLDCRADIVYRLDAAGIESHEDNSSLYKGYFSDNFITFFSKL